MAGWRVGDADAFEALHEKLIAAGFDVVIATPEQTRERRVIGLMRLVDPGGIPTEIFHSPLVDSHKPLAPGRPLFGKFATGDNGLGHVMLREPNEAAALAFYRMLGLVGGTEYLQTAPGGRTLPSSFMSCNGRQHTLAWINGGPKTLLHLMFEYTEMEDLGQTYDAARDGGIQLITTLGMHANDRALTFYMVTPSGWAIEPGWQVSTPRHAEHHTSDIFGHDLVNGQYVGNIEFRPR